MPRATSGTVKHNRSKKILKLAKGYRGGRSKLYRPAKQAVMKSGMYAYRDRKAKKRDFRQLWISRINARARMFGMSYSAFMHGLSDVGITINRKLLSDIAATDEIAFKKIVEIVKAHS
jgi:large subunit ribosomal protein L20